MLNINLKQLEVFVAVAEAASFSEASEQLYLTQSTVSSHLAALEEVLGVMLLRRGSRRKVELTEQGTALYHRCKDIVDSCKELEACCESGETELTIGASTVPMEHILPRLLTAFRQKHPNCRFVLKKGNSADIHQMLASGELSVGFVGTVLNRADLIYNRFCTDELVLVSPATAEYHELRKAGICGRELVSRPLIVRTPGSGTQLAVDDYLSRVGIPTEDIHVVARIESNTAILEAVSKGLGNAVLSELAAKSWVESGKLLAFRLEKEPVCRELYLTYGKKRRQSAMAKQFIAFVNEESKSHF